MNFLEWLKSMDPTVNWLAIRDRQGLPGIEKELVQIVEQTGSLHLPPIYDAFFSNADPWSEKEAQLQCSDGKACDDWPPCEVKD